MFTLMRKYYDAVTEESFRVDLARKDAVILLRDQDELQGFSTLVSLQITVGKKMVYGAFLAWRDFSGRKDDYAFGLFRQS